MKINANSYIISSFIINLLIFNISFIQSQQIYIVLHPNA